MSRKLRFEIGDYVTLKITWGRGYLIGKITEKYRHSGENIRLFGVFGYRIEWLEGDEANNSGWSILDITRGRLKYLKDLTALDILYGRKNIQKGS